MVGVRVEDRVEDVGHVVRVVVDGMEDVDLVVLSETGSVNFGAVDQVSELLHENLHG